MKRDYYITPKAGEIMRFLWKCAGGDRYILERATYSDQIKYMCLGGIVFATGTPVSNSMTELYTMQRYLQFDELKKNGLEHFDSWAANFGETVSAFELSPEGTGYRVKTRFSKFFNLPELMSMFKEVADIKTADMLNLPTPEARFEVIKTMPSEEQKENLWAQVKSESK